MKTKKRTVGIRASNPQEILHMDVTIFKPLDQTKVYIYFIVDNYSRAILNWKASLEYSSTIALDILKEASQKHAIGIDTRLVTDGGPENQGEVSTFVSEKENINRVVAQKDIIQWLKLSTNTSNTTICSKKIRKISMRLSIIYPNR